MNNLKKCLICDSENVEVRESEVRKFLVERMFEFNEQENYLIHCKYCGFAFYSLRPTEEQLNKFYQGYRNDEYQKQRQKFECWYTKEINEAIGKTKEEIENRQILLENILIENMNINEIKSVLDYGGDKGQLISGIFNNSVKYVYDISQVEAVPNVTALNTITAVAERKYDFIMSTHVLEHVCYPDKIIKEIQNLLAKDGYFYLELPLDSPFYKNPFAAFQFLFNKYFPLKTIWKHYWYLKKYKKFVPMHEHINYFTPESVKYMLEQNGFEVVYSEVLDLNVGWSKGKAISTLARLATSN